MISYIKGTLVACQPTNVIIENSSGMGMHIEISLQTYEVIKSMKEVQLYTHLHFKKDGQVVSGIELYGFYEQSEKTMFELLILVSGIGTNTARLMLSAMRSEEIRGAILTDNESKISSIKGIGPKTAKRLILELKDKMLKMDDGTAIEVSSNNKLRDDALIALSSLGFQKNTVLKALATVEKNYPEVNKVEDIIKYALKIL
jgi:Holliday junction DNA helicase RuvA